MVVAFPVLLMAALGAVRLIGYSSQIILTGSMRPMAAPGSVVVMRPVDAADVEVGMVVLIARAPRDGRPVPPVMHRVVSLREEDGLVHAATKGDANEAADVDPFVIRDRTYTPVVVVPYLGYFFSAMRTPIGWMAVAVLPWAVFAVGRLRRIWGAAADGAGDASLIGDGAGA